MVEKVIGHIPIMLRSMACHLHGITPAELVKKGEHEQMWGGYFIVGGHERLITVMSHQDAADHPEELPRGYVQGELEEQGQELQ